MILRKLTITSTKAIKNEVEISGMIESHIRDAVALCDWASMMEEQLQVSDSQAYFSFDNNFVRY